MKLSDLTHRAGEWLRGVGPMHDVVISSRVRYARNLAGMPFLSRCTGEQLRELETRLRDTVLDARLADEMAIALGEGARHLHVRNNALNFTYEHFCSVLDLIPARQFSDVHVVLMLGRFDARHAARVLREPPGVFEFKVGVQSLSAAACRAARRPLYSIDMIRERIAPLAGHSRVDVDYMFPLPGETYDEFRAGIEALLAIPNVSVTVNQLTLTPEQTKGERSRVVFLPAKLRQCIADYLASHKTKQWLFQSQKTEKFTANTLQATMTAIYAKAGFTGCSSHSGRRSFLTKLASQGVSVRVLQELAGHRHLTTTQRYIDVNDDMKRSALMLI